jgi:hypothetical protein
MNAPRCPTPTAVRGQTLAFSASTATEGRELVVALEGCRPAKYSAISFAVFSQGGFKLNDSRARASVKSQAARTSVRDA